MSLDPEQLRQVMRAWTTGVAVLTAVHEGVEHGMTVNSFTSISLDPPLITVALQGSARTRDLVMRARAFGLTILAAEQEQISARFAGEIPDVEDRLAGLRTHKLVSGAPLLEGGLAWLDCRVLQTVPAGENTLFVAEVLEARALRQDEPLVYHNRRYRRLRA